MKLTRMQVLEKAKEIYVSTSKKRRIGVCYAVDSALCYHGINKLLSYTYRGQIFPLFTFENARKFGAEGNDTTGFWWNLWEYDKRIRFLDWLIEQYKGDVTDLRGIYSELKKKELTP